MYCNWTQPMFVPSSPSSDTLLLSALTSQSGGRQANTSSTDSDVHHQVEDTSLKNTSQYTTLHINTVILNQWNRTYCLVILEPCRYIIINVINKCVGRLLERSMSFGSNYRWALVHIQLIIPIIFRRNFESLQVNWICNSVKFIHRQAYKAL